VLGLVALQIVLFPIESRMSKWMVPLDLRIDLSLHEFLEQLYFIRVLLPVSIIKFILNYVVCFIIVFIVFTDVLFDRCFKCKVIILGILYSVVAVTIYILPGIVDVFILPNYFYPSEKFFLDLTAAVIVSGLSIWVGHLLLKHKITV